MVTTGNHIGLRVELYSQFLVCSIGTWLLNNTNKKSNLQSQCDSTRQYDTRRRYECSFTREWLTVIFSVRRSHRKKRFSPRPFGTQRFLWLDGVYCTVHISQGVTLISSTISQPEDKSTYRSSSRACVRADSACLYQTVQVFVLPLALCLSVFLRWF